MALTPHARKAYKNLLGKGQLERGKPAGSTGPNPHRISRVGGGHPYAGLSVHQLKKKESRAFADVQQLREQGNMRGVKKAKPQLNKLRHRLTQQLLGNVSTTGSGQGKGGFKTHLGQGGSSKRQQVRYLLKQKLGNRFGDFYNTGQGSRQYLGERGQRNAGNIGTSGPPQTTTGRRIGPPARRRRSGYGGY